MSKTPFLLAIIGLVAILMALGLNEFVWQNELTPDEEVKTKTSAAPSSEATTPVKEPTTPRRQKMVPLSPRMKMLSSLYPKALATAQPKRLWF